MLSIKPASSVAPEPVVCFVFHVSFCNYPIVAPRISPKFAKCYPISAPDIALRFARHGPSIKAPSRGGSGVRGKENQRIVATKRSMSMVQSAYGSDMSYSLS